MYYPKQLVAWLLLHTFFTIYLKKQGTERKVWNIICEINKYILQSMLFSKLCKLKTYVQIIDKYPDCNGQNWYWFVNDPYKLFKALRGISPPYIQDLFGEKDVPYSLRASKIVTQPKCQSTAHGLNSLTHQCAKLWNTLNKLKVQKL